MSAIDKLISKFNKAKSAVNSFKGIQSKIKSIKNLSKTKGFSERAYCAGKRKSLASKKSSKR